MNLFGLKQFKAERINEDQLDTIVSLARKARSDIVKMIMRAGSGHLGGSLSSIDIYLILWLCADISPELIDNPSRDRIVVSHGHTAAGVYSVLGNVGYFDVEKAVKGFRKNGSSFEGHPSTKIPGVEWCSGSLGQGLSVGCGFALSAKLKKVGYHVFVVMGDGEQGKGQLGEAREFAVKFGLGNLTAVIDYNRLQASGKVLDIMPQNIAEKYIAAGFRVIEINGHDYQEIYQALRKCYMDKEKPTLILTNTIMGKGVSFIENNYEYHGKVFTEQQYEQAMSEIISDDKTDNGLDNKDVNEFHSVSEKPVETRVKYGTPILYKKDKITDCRTAVGEALVDIAVANSGNSDVTIAALDCDLAESVKLSRFGNEFPQNLIECGIQEHNAATVAAALSKSGILTFLADFGVFGIDETYGQHRMSDLNNTSLKLICTHNGLDVGEDGKTHQCIDYISIMSNLFGFKIIIPSDANQADRAVRYAATHPGNMVIVMGRSKLPVLTTELSEIFYNADYVFEYGEADWIREGKDGIIITCGTMVHKAVNACEKLKSQGISVGILNLSCPLQLDTLKINEAAKTGLIITYEDHNIRTGIGSIIGTYLAENKQYCNFKRIGISEYGASASPDILYRLQGMDEDSLVELVKQELRKL